MTTPCHGSAVIGLLGTNSAGSAVQRIIVPAITLHGLATSKLAHRVSAAARTSPRRLTLTALELSRSWWSCRWCEDDTTSRDIFWTLYQLTVTKSSSTLFNLKIHRSTYVMTSLPCWISVSDVTVFYVTYMGVSTLLFYISTAYKRSVLCEFYSRKLLSKASSHASKNMAEVLRHGYGHCRRPARFTLTVEWMSKVWSTNNEQTCSEWYGLCRLSETDYCRSYRILDSRDSKETDLL